MEFLFIWYPKCSTCQKAKKWLDAHGIAYTARHIVEEVPTEEELSAWSEKSGRELKTFFNTSGMKYRELELKEKLPSMNDSEKISLLASDGMLIKRPLLVGDNVVLNGFREKEWEQNLL